MYQFSAKKPKKQTAMELTSYLMHKHYCEHDVESIVELLHSPMIWFGAGENEYAVGKEKVAEIFRQFAGRIPPCEITKEEYEAAEITPQVTLCTGRMWISTTPSAEMYLRAHQRITTVFCWIGDEARCCHIHISNPYSEMNENDIGFPSGMGYQSYAYVQERIDEEKKRMEARTSLLQRLSFEDSLTGLFNRNKFKYDMDSYNSQSQTCLGVAYFDLNGLKEVNDHQGHSAGDDLLCRAAGWIKKAFSQKAYRIGGDEFVVVDKASDQLTFQNAVETVRQNMKADGISCSVGYSWRCTDCDIQQQSEEADEQMYKEKMRFYTGEGDRRRKN